MQSFALLLLGLVILGACIWFLHRTQMRRTVENADLTAPLDTLDEAPPTDFAGAAQQSVSVAAVESPAVEAPVAETAVVTNVTEVPTDPVPIATPEPVAASVADEMTTSVSDTVSATASIAASVPVSSITPESTPATNDNWLTRIRSLRDSGQLDAALAASRAQFPKTQAFQQAAIILRQQIREALEKFQPADSLLLELYHTAALADLFRTSSSHKPRDQQAALDAVRGHAFLYTALGHLRLKLLNKSDVRALEQLWGAPPVHRHTEDLLGEEWLKWCRNP